MVRKKNSFIITDINEKVNEKEIKTKSNKRFIEPKNEPKLEIRPKISHLKTESIGGSVSNKPFKTNRFLNKCFEKRREKGMLLLSPKVEKKIYNLKKGLRNKGMNEMEIKDIIRKRRREEENKYMRDAATQCFKCRQSGHKLADCPQNADNCEEGSDICYRCGSTEHKLSECGQKSVGLPFAKCFLCSQTGHLTRDCTQNARGVYPKGGHCKACHSVNHLIKDCPQNQKEEEMENEITLTTLEANHSVDSEVMDTGVMGVLVKTEKNGPKKVIKF